MDTVIIDISELETPADLHEIIKLKLDLPEYYGRNLDALHDVLTSISSLHLILCGSNDTYNSIKDYLPRLQRVLSISADNNPNFTYEMK
ncbi:ribonuclease inhibitor [Ruminococcaceae bacterium KH2T8]|nr:ribonuclease inhibitor [Ruminococcaceae bacterium KH2T8]